MGMYCWWGIQFHWFIEKSWLGSSCDDTKSSDELSESSKRENKLILLKGRVRLIVAFYCFIWYFYRSFFSNIKLPEEMQWGRRMFSESIWCSPLAKGCVSCLNLVDERREWSSWLARTLVWVGGQEWVWKRG